MTSNKSLFHWTLSITLLAFIVFLSACKTSTEPDPEPDPEPEPIPAPPPPEIPDGQRVMVIQVADRDDAALTGYDIDISGPTSISAEGVGESSFRFEDLESGEYKIVVTLEGYLKEELTLEVELPESVKDDYEISESVSLAKQAPPVEIKNDEENTVSADSEEEGSEEDEKLKINIPANTFPESAQDENGNVQVRVTRAAPSSLTQDESGGVVTDGIALEPSGVTLNNPVSISIPINATAGVNYVLQPGNIPLTPAAGKAASLSADQRTVIEFEGNILEWIFYRVVADAEVTVERQATIIQLDPSGCGVDATFSYSTPVIEASSNGRLLPDAAARILTSYNTLYGTRDLSLQRTISNDNDNYRINGAIAKGYLAYSVRSGNLTETFNRNVALVLVAQDADCHGSSN